MKKLIIAMLFVLSLSGCSHNQVPNDTKYIQESLLVQCTDDTPLPAGLTGEDMYKALNDWQAIYNECRASKAALIRAVRNDPDNKSN